MNKFQKVLYHLLLTILGGIIVGITMTFFTEMWRGVSSFSSEIRTSNLQNQVRNMAIEKVFVDKISQIKLEVKSLHDTIKDIESRINNPLIPFNENIVEPRIDLIDEFEQFDSIQQVLKGEIEQEYNDTIK